MIAGKWICLSHKWLVTRMIRIRISRHPKTWIRSWGYNSSNIRWRTFQLSPLKRTLSYKPAWLHSKMPLRPTISSARSNRNAPRKCSTRQTNQWRKHFSVASQPTFLYSPRQWQEQHLSSNTIINLCRKQLSIKEKALLLKLTSWPNKSKNCS